MNNRLYKYELKPFFSCGERGEGLYLYNEESNVIETRYYIGGYEVFRKEVNNTFDFERTTLNISDDEKVFVSIEQKTGKRKVVRYQYDNHLGSACLELNENGLIISYEEYHPFGTTSYRSGRTETEVSQKRYRYCGKERDEETGLYYYGMRYYAAWICRFVSVDSLQFKYPELTPFQYSSNNPITMIDLDGLEGVRPENIQIQPFTPQRIDIPLPGNGFSGMDPSGAGGSAGQRGQQNLSETTNARKVQITQQAEKQAEMKARIPTITAADPNYYSPEAAQARDVAAMINAGLEAQGPLISGGSGFGVGAARDPAILLAARYLLFSPLELGFTASTLFSGVGDFVGQMTTKQYIMEWNIPQTTAAALLKTPSVKLSLGSAAFSSAFEITPKNILDENTGLFDNTIFGDKSLAKFGVETGFGGLSNYFGGQINLEIENSIGNAATTGFLQIFSNVLFNSINKYTDYKCFKDTITTR